METLQSLTATTATVVLTAAAAGHDGRSDIIHTHTHTLKHTQTHTHSELSGGAQRWAATERGSPALSIVQSQQLSLTDRQNDRWTGERGRDGLTDAA